MADNTLKLIIATQKTHLKSAFISKSDALINVLMMVVNNCSFGFMWWALFNSKQQINGWNFDDMLILFAVSCNAFWLFATFFRGIEDIPRFVENGNMDGFLTSPHSPLLMLSISRSSFSNWGDMLTGYLAFFLTDYVSWENFVLITILSVYAFLITYGFILIFASLSLFFKNMDRPAHSAVISFTIVQSQPASIFSGWYKVMIFTIIPVGFTTLLPVRMIQNFNWTDFLYINLGALFFLVTAIWLFNKGLKNYSSGNRFGVR